MGAPGHWYGVHPAIWNGIVSRAGSQVAQRPEPFTGQQPVCRSKIGQSTYSTWLRWPRGNGRLLADLASIMAISVSYGT